MWKAWSAVGPHRSETARNEIQSTSEDQQTWAIAQVSMSVPMASGKRSRMGPTLASVQKESEETMRPRRTGCSMRPRRMGRRSSAASEVV